MTFKTNNLSVMDSGLLLLCVFCNAFSLAECWTDPLGFPPSTANHMNMMNETDPPDFSVILDPLVRNITDQFHRHCPYNTLCNVRTYYDFHAPNFVLVNNTRESKCCGQCDCEKTCLPKHSCCPDALDALVSLREVQESEKFDTLTDCIALQYRPYNENEANFLDVRSFYKAVTKCPKSFVDGETKMKCETRFYDPDIAHSMHDLIPVSDIHTNVTYKNSNCAACHGVLSSSYMYWKPYVECKEGAPNSPVLVEDQSDILSFIRSNPFCNIHFYIPEKMDVDSIDTCDPLIGRCNVTGNWADFDMELSRACHSYTSSYQGYTNVHCFLCNGHTESDIDHVCFHRPNLGFLPIASSFVALLDFNDLEKTGSVPQGMEDMSCSSGEMYDPKENTCRKLICPVSTKLQNGHCIPVFTSYESHVEPVNFILEFRMLPKPSTTVDTNELWFLREQFILNVFGVKYDITSNSTEVCNIHMFLKLGINVNEHDRQTMDDIDPAKFKHIDARVRLCSTLIHNTTEFLQEVLELFDAMSNTYKNWTMGYTVIDDMYFDKSNYIYATPSVEDIVDNYLEWNSLSFIFEDPMDGMSVNPYPPMVVQDYGYEKSTNAALKLSPKYFCPKIEITVSTDSAPDIRNIINELGLNQTDVVAYVSDNETKLLVCSHDYSEVVQRLAADQTPRDEATYYSAEAILSIVCICISLFCLLITFVMYCMFSILRTVPGINNMGLLFHLFFAQILYLVGGTVEILNDKLCKLIGVMLHYMLISSFFWMFVCTFHMLRVFINIFKNAGKHTGMYVNVKYVLLAEIPTTIVVAVTVLVSLLRSDMESIGYGGQPCYVSDADMIYFTVAIPLGFVLISNLFMFIFVIVKISRVPSMKKHSTKERSNILIFLKLSSITGLTWIFGFIYQWTSVTAFAYIFIILNGCQGVLIMVSFVINKRVFDLVASASTRYMSRYRERLTETTTSFGLSASGRLSHAGDSKVYVVPGRLSANLKPDENDIDKTIDLNYELTTNTTTHPLKEINAESLEADDKNPSNEDGCIAPINLPVTTSNDMNVTDHQACTTTSAACVSLNQDEDVESRKL